MKKFSILLVFSFLFFTACDTKFLDKKPDKSQKVPSTLDDFWAILNFDQTKSASVELAITGSDDFYLTDPQWNSLQATGMTHQANAFVWEKEVYPDKTVLDWNRAYGHILYANVVLEGLQKIDKKGDVSKWDLIQGSALFYRAYSYYQLAQNFCPPYVETSAQKDLGLPLRKDSDHGSKVSRSSLQETFRFIINDLQEAIQILPSRTQHLFFAPSKTAAYALLAKVYLVMGNYKEALKYANACLELQPGLLDFNQLSLEKPIPFTPLDLVLFDPSLNPEVILFASIKGDNSGFIRMAFHPDISQIDTNLLALYSDHDLRKQVYFKKKTSTGNTMIFRSSYMGISNGLFSVNDRSGGFFGGIATDELYLIQAECLARLGDVPKSLEVINLLLKHRYVQGKYQDFSTSDSAEALRFILTERRKELVFRGTRWEDLRRLNLEPALATTLKRSLNGREYVLEPNSKRYTWPIPDQEVFVGGVKQNER